MDWKFEMQLKKLQVSFLIKTKKRKKEKRQAYSKLETGKWAASAR